MFWSEHFLAKHVTFVFCRLQLQALRLQIQQLPTPMNSALKDLQTPNTSESYAGPGDETQMTQMADLGLDAVASKHDETLFARA